MFCHVWSYLGDTDFCSQTAFLPEVSPENIKQLALHSPLGSAELISPLQCAAVKLSLPQTSRPPLQDPRKNKEGLVFSPSVLPKQVDKDNKGNKGVSVVATTSE